MGIELDRFMAQSGFKVRWNRHRNEPGCVVGEHRHCPPPPLSLPSALFGDIEMLLILVLTWNTKQRKLRGREEGRERESEGQRGEKMPLRAASVAAPPIPIFASRNYFLSPNHHHHHQLPAAANAADFSHARIPRSIPSHLVFSRNGFNFVSSKRRRLVFVAEAVDSSSQTAGNKSIVADDQFSLSKISFGVVGLGSGITLLAYGFGAYFNVLPGSEWSALMLTYGFPVAVIGMALKYAELKPVPCVIYADAEKLREKCATDILKQVKSDVTRYRYGDEQHLDEALRRIFQYGQGGGIPRRSAPILQMIREEVTEDGRYCLVLVFEAKSLQLSDFEQRQAKFTSFFGPGITAEVGKGENDLYEVRLISNTQA